MTNNDLSLEQLIDSKASVKYQKIVECLRNSSIDADEKYEVLGELCQLFINSQLLQLALLENRIARVRDLGGVPGDELILIRQEMNNKIRDIKTIYSSPGLSQWQVIMADRGYCSE